MNSKGNFFIKPCVNEQNLLIKILIYQKSSTHSNLLYPVCHYPYPLNAFDVNLDKWIFAISHRYIHWKQAHTHIYTQGERGKFRERVFEGVIFRWKYLMWVNNGNRITQGRNCLFNLSPSIQRGAGCLDLKRVNSQAPRLKLMIAIRLVSDYAVRIKGKLYAQLFVFV